MSREHRSSASCACRTFPNSSAPRALRGLAQWTAFLRKSGAAEPGALAAIVDEIVGLVWQPLEAAARDGAFELRWPPGGPWQT